MQENIIISFTSESGDIDQTVTKFKKLTEEEKKFREQSKKTEEQTKKQSQTTKKTTDDQQKSLAALAKQYGNMEKVIANGAAFTSMRSALKDVTQELARMELQGQQNTEEFRNLRAVAGELQDSMDAVRGRIQDAASDTHALDGVVALAESVAAGFSLAQGAAALFGSSSKDLEKALVPLQAVMSILIGLTTLKNAIQEESILRTRIESIQTKAGAAAVRLETAAKSQNIIVSKGAIITQSLLNAVMKANPVFLLISGVGLLVAALSAFVLMGESAAEKQEKLNNKLSDGIDITKRFSEHLTVLYADLDKQLSRQIELYSAQGKSLEKIQRLEKARTSVAVDGANDQIEANKRLIDSLADNEDKVRSINAALSRFASGNKRARVTVEVEGKLMNFKIKDEDQKANLEKLRDLYTDQIKMAKDAIDQKKDADASAQIYEIEALKKLNESKLRGTLAYYEAVALKANEGTYQEYQAQVNLVNEKAKLDILSIKQSNNSEKEKANQVLKITVQRMKEQKALEDVYNIEQIARQKNTIDAELALVTEGTKQELDLKIESITKQRDADIIAAKDNSSKKMLIEASYQKDLKQLNDAYQKKVLDDYISAEEAKTNIALSRAAKGSEQELRIKKELIDLQADAEANSISFSEKNEDLRRVKIQAVYAKALEDKRQLERDKTNAEIDAKLNDQNLNREGQNIEIEKQISKSLFFEWGSRAKLEKELQANKLKAIDDERDAFKSKLDNNIITQQEYNSKMTELNNQQAQIELEQIQKEEEAKKEIQQASIDLLTSSMNAYFDSKKERLQQDLDALQNNYTTDAQEAKTNANKKLITAEEMKRRELQIKRDMAKVEKDQAIFNATINMALGVTKALSSAPPPFNAILAGITAAAALVQIIAIKNRPLPKYWKGRKSGKGEWARVGEYGPEDVFIPGGAAIIPSHHSRTLAEADRILANYNIPNQNYSLRSASTALANNAIGANGGIDYDRLGDAIASKIRNNSVSVSMDRNGYNVFLNESNTRSRIMNTNYTLNLN